MSKYLSTAPILPQIDSLEASSSFENLMFTAFTSSQHSQHSHDQQYPPSSAPRRGYAGTGHLIPYSSDQTSTPTESVASMYQISPSLNTNDMVALNFLVQTSIAGSEGFRVLSEMELQALKSEQQILASRRGELEHKLSLETKMKDAATSISKYHLNQQEYTSPTQAAKKSIFSSKKRLSKQALGEAELSNQRISTYSLELSGVLERIRECQIIELQHSVAVLALTHPGSGSPVSNGYLSATGARVHDGTRQETDHATAKAPATLRMSQYSRSSYPAISNQPPQNTKLDADELDPIIETVSKAVVSPEVVTSGRGKLGYLHHLTKSLVQQHTATTALLEEREKQITELSGQIHGVVLELNGSGSIDTRSAGLSSYVVGSSALVDAVRAYKVQSAADKQGLEEKLATQMRSQHTAEANGAISNTKYQEQLQTLQESYESNRADLEKLELENIDLKNELKDLRLAYESEVEALGVEAQTDKERVEEWKERSAATQAELDEVVKSLQNLTREAVEYESERAKLETTIASLQKKVFEASNESLATRMSLVTLPRSPVVDQLHENGFDPRPSDSSAESLSEADRHLVHDTSTVSPTTPPMSVSIMQQEFRRILHEVNTKHSSELRKEQLETRKVQHLLRSYRVSSVTSSSGGSSPGLASTTGGPAAA